MARCGVLQCLYRLYLAVSQYPSHPSPSTSHQARQWHSGDHSLSTETPELLIESFHQANINLLFIEVRRKDLTTNYLICISINFFQMELEISVLGVPQCVKYSIKVSQNYQTSFLLPALSSQPASV